MPSQPHESDRLRIDVLQAELAQLSAQYDEADAEVAKLRRDMSALEEELAEARTHLGVIVPMLTEDQALRWRTRTIAFRAEEAAARMRGA